MRRSMGLILATLILVLPFFSVAETAQRAEHLSDYCRYGAKGGCGHLNFLKDVNFESEYCFVESGYISISWTEEVAADRICLLFNRRKAEVSLSIFDGNDRLLQLESPEEGRMLFIISLPKDARSFRLDCGAGVSVGACKVYGEGLLPKPFCHNFNETPEDLDFLLISTHPDDEVLFMGAVIPICAAEQGYSGTVLYITHKNAWRLVEAHNGCAVMGLDNYPIFADFLDALDEHAESTKKNFNYDDILLYLVRLYRQRRPEVVFTHDLNGEYGHWQHKYVARAALEAIPLAADPSCDPESAQSYGTHQVQKCYLHLYPENQILFDTQTPLAAFDGKTAFEVAEAAFLEHGSQQHSGYAVRDWGEHNMALFGLAYSYKAVEGDGIFDGAFTPTPSPTPTPAPTPTPTLTPAPTNTLAPTAKPASTPAPVQAEKDKPASPLLPILCGVCAALLLCTLIPLLKKRKK
ncbi:MAG: PIG-L family deacetylase [Clostridia bacterium]|nr:PIG-L family deacetylase [Clostridia bacterium]